MALSDQGILYAWGNNSYGQLGSGNRTDLVVPQIIAPEIGRVVEIAAFFNSNISAAMTQISKVYMWGQCRGQSVLTPRETPFHSMQEVFARFADPAVTWRPMKLDVVPVRRVSDSFRIAFDDPQSSDVKFFVGGKFIHVHKSVLKIRCEHFRSMFEDHRKDVVEIDEYSYSVYRAFLQYLYTDTVELPLEEAIDLLDLAISYREQLLKRHCERIIEQGIIVDNVAAVKYKPRMDLEKWTIFSLLSTEFVGKIRLACVFGDNEALVVTVDDDVYRLDYDGCFEPRKLEGLCQKNVKSISYGEDHLLAVTKSGDLYGWGYNGHGQMGNGTTDWMWLPIQVTANLLGKKVTDVACGLHHSLALTSEGEVFAWGRNDFGQMGSGSTMNQLIPRKVTACIGGRQVIIIACGYSWSMAVLDNGEVYGWGHNDKGQLGLGNTVDQTEPCRTVSLQGVVITQIVCGCDYTMALSDQGVLYAWGSNFHGQLGIGNEADFVVPQIVASEIGRVVEIAASLLNSISAAMTQTSKVYMWGWCLNRSVSTPTETPFHSMQDVFARFADRAVTWRPMKLDVPVTCVSDSFRIAFDDPQTSDVKFLVEGRLIHVHKSVLKIRCEYFQSMFQDHWEEDGKDVVEIDCVSYSVYHAFLQYLYTDTVELPPEEAIGLFDLAHCYCEQQLKCLCERIVKHGITVDNVIMIYAAAIKYEARELEELCFRFIRNHTTAVIQTDAFLTLEEPTLKDFVFKAAQFDALKC